MQPIYFLINETMGRGRPKKYKTEEERKAANREYLKRWREENADKVKEYQKQWREAHPDYDKQRYQDNPEKKKEMVRRYYQENREKMIDYQKQYQNTPIGRAAHLVSNYQQADKKYSRGECTLTAQWIVDNIFNKPCHYNCGKEGWEVIGCDRIDNSLPHTIDNVVPCCDECNVKRNRKTYEEFLMSLSGINKSVS